MATFNVETEELRRLATELAAVDQTLDQLGRLVGGDSGALGSVDVQHALEDFVGNWSQGIARTGELASGLQRVAAGAANRYDEADSSITRAAEGH